MITDTTLITLIFTNNHVNKPSDISLSVKPLTYPRYVSTINCSSVDGVWMHDVHNKFLFEIGQRLRKLKGSMYTHRMVIPQSSFSPARRKAD